jgi:hypothetical protein
MSNIDNEREPTNNLRTPKKEAPPQQERKHIRLNKFRNISNDSLDEIKQKLFDCETAEPPIFKMKKLKDVARHIR